MTNPTGGTMAYRAYDAFGVRTIDNLTPVGPFGYAAAHGYQGDEDSGLMLLGHRYYDPSTGRFLTRDPIKDGRNWYGYCGNNPLRWVDVEGFQKAKPQKPKNGKKPPVVDGPVIFPPWQPADRFPHPARIPSDPTPRRRVYPLPPRLGLGTR